MPVLLLLLIAPFVGEYLLGNLPLDSGDALAAVVPLALLYGCGAVLVREVVAQAGRGWPTVVLLALAYGVVEEGIVTQSLFNPSYVGFDLNAYGTIPGTGTGAPWLVSVLTLHTVWSISVPIALVEAVFPARRGVPWLRWPVLIPIALLYLAGAALVGFGTAASESFVARPAELAVTAVAAVALIVLAFLVPRRDAATPGRAVPWAVAAFACGSAFFMLYLLGIGERALHPALYVVVVLALIVGPAAAVYMRGAPPLALAAGAVLTYCWAGVFVQRDQYGYSPVQAAAQVSIVIVAIGLLVLAARRDGHPDAPTAGTSGSPSPPSETSAPTRPS